MQDAGFAHSQAPFWSMRGDHNYRLNLLRNSHLALELEGEVGLVSPVKEKRYLEGD